MNKLTESNCVKRIYGAAGLRSVIVTESPDFIIQLDDYPQFGVEITEYYVDESRARLHNIKGYASELISARRFRHKDDTRILRVEPVTYMPGGDRIRGRNVTALIMEGVSLTEKLSRLGTLIGDKEAKAQRYLKHSPRVDLIVSDADNAFSFEECRDFYVPLSVSNERSKIIGSRFNEIYLMTRGVGMREVGIPLRGCAFVEEVFTCQHMCFNEATAILSKSPRAFFGTLMHVLNLVGFGETAVSFGDQGLSLRFASIEMIFSQARPIQIFARNPWYTPGSKVSSVRDIIRDLSSDSHGFATEVLRERPNLTVSIDLSYAC